jgi:hypothetical protein
MLDVSQKKLSGHLPSCLGNYSLKGDSEKAVGAHESIIPYKSMEKLYSETMGQQLVRSIANEDGSFPSINIEESIEFTSKKCHMVTRATFSTSLIFVSSPTSEDLSMGVLNLLLLLVGE